MAQSAQEVLRSILDEFDLGNLATWAWNDYLNSGASDLASYQPELFQKITTQQEFIDKYPAYQTLIKQGRGLTVKQYRDYTLAVQDALHQFGIPDAMYGSPAKIGEMLTNNVSAAEATDRLRLAAQAAYTAPQEVRDALTQMYGVDQGDIFAFWLEPDRAVPILEQKYVAAQVAGAATARGVATDQATVERLAGQGVSYQEALQGFATVKSLEGLASASGDNATTADTTAAAFGDAAAREKVLRAQRARQAEFAQSGGVSADQRGVAGLGSSSR